MFDYTIITDRLKIFSYYSPQNLKTCLFPAAVVQKKTNWRGINISS